MFAKTRTAKMTEILAQTRTSDTHRSCHACQHRHRSPRHTHHVHEPLFIHWIANSIRPHYSNITVPLNTRLPFVQSFYDLSSFFLLAFASQPRVGSSPPIPPFLIFGSKNKGPSRALSSSRLKFQNSRKKILPTVICERFTCRLQPISVPLLYFPEYFRNRRRYYSSSPTSHTFLSISLVISPLLLVHP